MRATTFAAVALLVASCSTAPPPVPAATPAPAAEAAPTNPALEAELMGMLKTDQEVRQRWLKDQKNEAIRDEMKTLGAAHVARFEEIIAEHGWPGKSMVGRNGATAAWTIAQHGGKDLLGRTIGMMYQAVLKGDLAEGLYATSLDRVLTQQGKKQMYGTQFDTDPATGKCEPMPIEDAEHVDERRIRAGMGPLADYKEQLCKMYLQKQP
jgi:hypothetical protein